MYIAKSKMSIINPLRMRKRVTVVYLSVCLSPLLHVNHHTFAL